MSENPSYPAKLLADVRDEIGRADNKASTLLATLGVGFGLVGGALISGNLDYTVLGHAARSSLWAAATFAVLSLGAAGLAIWPRHSAITGSNQILYWSQVARYASLAEFQTALRKQSEVGHSPLDNQLWTLSRLVRAKYTCIRVALVLAAFSVLSIFLFALLR